MAKNKWLTASVADDAAGIFDHAERRDPAHQRPWIALVDGNNHQIHRIKTEAKTRKIPITIIVDLIHVLEYLWKAAWCFHDPADPAAEAWVKDKATAVLNGQASTVAASIRRKATCLRLPKTRRANADTCADYLLRKKPYLDYPTALAKGWPIATGVIEGACRHLIKDRIVFSSPHGVGFCPLRRQTVLVGYSSASYGLPRVGVSRRGELQSVQGGAPRRPGVLDGGRR